MIAYYAHEHGYGHSKFAQMCANAMAKKVKIYTSSDYTFHNTSDVVRLPSENPDGTAYKDINLSMPDYLHYSPINQSSIQLRSMQLLHSMILNRVQFAIVDVSVEIAALLRSASFPYVYIKLPGVRNDLPHLNALKGSVFNMAYYPAENENALTAEWVKAKTLYLGYPSDLKIVENTKKDHTSPQLLNITVITGNGGNESVTAYLPLIIQRFPLAKINILGSFSSSNNTPNVRYRGFVKNVTDYMHQSDLVIANCGLGLVSNVLTSGKPFCAIPEERPFGEQEDTFNALLNQHLIVSIHNVLHSSDSELYNQLSNLRPMVQNSCGFDLLNTMLEEVNYDLPKLLKNITSKLPAKCIL